MSENCFAWLHLTDLHYGLDGQGFADQDLHTVTHADERVSGIRIRDALAQGILACPSSARQVSPLSGECAVIVGGCKRR